MSSPNIEDWHHLTENEVIDRWSSDQNSCLNPSDIEHRLEQHGLNAITTQRRQSPFIRFLLQFHQPLIYILIISGVFTALLHE